MGGQPIDEEQFAFARRIALARLAERAHSEDEFRKALARRNVPKSVVDELVGRFREIGLINDADFAAQWVQSRHEHRHVSRRMLARELAVKGIAPEEAEAALGEIDAAAERQAALAVARKKAAGLSGQSREVAWRRLTGALGRRGFSPGVVVEVAQEALREAGPGCSGEPGDGGHDSA